MLREQVTYSGKGNGDESVPPYDMRGAENNGKETRFDYDPTSEIGIQAALHVCLRHTIHAFNLIDRL